MILLLKEHSDVFIPKFSRDSTCILDPLWLSVTHQGRDLIVMLLESTSQYLKQGQLIPLRFQPN